MKPNNEIFLDRVHTNSVVILREIVGGQALTRRLLDLGLRKGVRFKVLRSQRGGPCLVEIAQSRFVLGHGMRTKLRVEVVQL